MLRFLSQLLRRAAAKLDELSRRRASDRLLAALSNYYVVMGETFKLAV